MEVEMEAYKRLVFMLEQSMNRTEEMFKELKSKKFDNWLSVKQVQEYTGFGYDWVYSRKHALGCSNTGKGLRFKKSAVDKYMEANSSKK